MDAAGRERARAAVADAAAALVAPGMVVGLGSGDTAAHFVRALAARRVAIRGVATSPATAQLAAQLGMALVPLAEAGAVDLAVDGADEVNSARQLIKGGGGALLHEKIVAASAQRFTVIIDSDKRVERFSRALPVEFVPAARQLVARSLRALAGLPSLREVGGAPSVTQEGNHIFDCQFDWGAQDPAQLAARLDALVGVVEHGLFVAPPERILMADASGHVQSW